MLKKKKSYYLVTSFVKKLSGFNFYRLSIYHRNKLIDVVGYLDINNNILFINFSSLLYYIYKGFDFIAFSGLIGNNLKSLNLGPILIMGLHNWIFFSKKNPNLLLPKKFWLHYFNRSLYIIYYLLFRNLIIFEQSGYKLVHSLSIILSKRFLVIKNLGLIN